MAQQTRNPTGDGTFTGTWDGVAGSRWTLVDDHPDSAGADLLTHGTTTAGRGPFTYSAFTVPTLAYVQSVQVLYYDRKDASQADSWGAYLRVNGVDRAVIDAHNLTNGSWVLRTATATTNPATGAAWTVADVNGTGTNPLQQFGVVATDVSPACKLASIQLVVNYIDPLTADSGSYTLTGTDATLRRGFTIVAASGSYALTGTAALLKHPVALSVGSGSYTLWGESVGLRGNHLFADVGTYEIVGSQSILAYGVIATSGTYTLTGSDATLIYTPVSGAFTLTADSGTYTDTGYPAGLTPLYTGGTYTLTGVSVVLAVKMAASSGTYTLVGTEETTLIWSGGAAPEIHLLACMGYGR